MLQKRIDDHAIISREAVREAEDIFHSHLKRVGLKLTGQRDTILLIRASSASSYAIGWSP